MRKIFYGWWIVILSFFFAAYAGATIWHSFTTLFDPLIKEFNWSYTSISIAASLRGAEFGLMDMAVGFLVDRFSIRRIILFGSVVVSIGWIMLSQVNNLGIFYTSFFIIGTGASGITGVVFTTLLSRWFTKRLGLVIGLNMCGFAIGGLAVPGIAHLLGVIGFRWVFASFGIAALLIGSITAFLVRDWPKDIGSGPDGAPIQLNTNTLDQGRTADQKGLDPSSYTLRNALSTSAFWIIAFAGIATSLSIMMLTTHIMPYLENIGYSRQTASFVAMIIPVTSMVGRLGGGWMLDRMNHWTGFILVLVGQFASVILLKYSIIPVQLILFITLFSISWGIMGILRPVALRNCFGTTYIGSVLGFCSGLTIVGSVGGPLLGGWIFDWTGSYDLAWLVAGILILASIPMVIVMKRTRRRSGYATSV